MSIANFSFLLQIRQAGTFTSTTKNHHPHGITFPHPSSLIPGGGVAPRKHHRPIRIEIQPKRLTERQDAEIAIYNRVKADLDKARKSMPDKEFMPYWEKRNDELRNLGIKTIGLKQD